MSTFAERFRQEGMEKGIQKGVRQGMQKGMQKGEAALLIRQLRRKFGELSEDKVRMIEAADTDQLLEWADRVLTAESLDEVLK
jgi:flagellar biosynthesis/type III secretory pathway protein FliH